ncbi:MAG: glycosyltransferase family 4 protein [Tannerellaceae bacterium]|jgi:glycosyltransferase involved in cell wall biosynthesis|nr:glycosyltransferase family 4 protein [Tannerellaceae bacterium]
MEILFVSHKFPPSTGGMEKHCYELLTSLERRCKTHRLIYDYPGSRLVFFLSLRRKIRKICKAHPQIGIIYFNDALVATFCSFPKPRRQVSYVVTLHGLDVVFPSRFYHRYIFNRLNFYDRLIAVSHATARKAIALGIAPEKVVVIPNGVDASQCRDTPEDVFRDWLSEKQIDTSGRKLLMMTGRPVKRKGFSWFAEHVFPQLQEDFYLIITGPFHPEPTLPEKIIYLLPGKTREKVMLFSGYFSDERQLRKIIRQSPRIRHVGRLPDDEVRMLYTKVDAFLMPNIAVEGDMEGFGLVCLEASAHGALVFASDIDGIPEAITDRKNGFLLPPEKVGAWVDTLNHLAHESASYQPCKACFSHFTQTNYGWEQMAGAYYEVFGSLGLTNPR